MSYKIFYPTVPMGTQALFSSGIYNVYISRKNRVIRKIYDFKIGCRGKNHDIRVDSDSLLRVKDTRLKKIDLMKSIDIYEAFHNHKKIKIEILDHSPRWCKILSISTSNKICDRLYTKNLSDALSVPIGGKLRYMVHSTEITYLSPSDVNDDDDHCDVLTFLHLTQGF